MALGVTDPFTNAHEIHGHLGDLTERLAAASATVQTLELYGHFALTRPLRLPRLRSLSVVLDDEVTGPNVPSLDPRTVTCLLTGDLPAVTDIWLALRSYDGDQIRYRLPALFLAGAGVPVLARFEVDAAALADGEAGRLRASPLSRRARVVIDPGR